MPDYKTDAGLLAHLQVQAKNIDDFAAAVGASAAAVALLKADADNLEQMIEFCQAVENYKTTIFGIKRAFVRGEMDDSLGAFPVAPPAPPLDLTAAVEKRSRERDQRYLRAEGVTEAARLALDLGGGTSRIDPASVKPAIKLTAGDADYEFTVEVSDKGDAEMFTVEIRRMNSEKWTEIKSGTGKSLIVAVAPTAAGQSERLEARVRLTIKNQDYGAASDPQFVTVNP